MCEPTTIALVASMAIAAVSGYVAYDSSKKAQKYNEEVAETNKKTLEGQALDAERLGQIERNERRLKTRMQLATQQVGFGAQNVETSGTALDILGDTALFGEIDENRITANAERKAFGFRYDAFNVEAGKRVMQFQAKNDRTGTILSTASSMLGAYGSYGKAASSNSFKSSGMSVQRESIPVYNQGVRI